MYGKSRPPPTAGFTGQGYVFRTYAQALLCQEKPCMRMQFREEGQNPNAVGVICHTMKFCDYYGFRYAAMKKKWKVPTLKIETDATPQSSGQLHTRLDAFFETIQPRKKVEVAKGVVNYVAGVDSGSASTDAVILDGEKRIVASTVLPTGAGAAAGVQSTERSLAASGIERRRFGGDCSNWIWSGNRWNRKHFRHRNHLPCQGCASSVPPSTHGYRHRRSGLQGHLP